MNVQQLLVELAEIRSFMDRQAAANRDITRMRAQQSSQFAKKVVRLPTFSAIDANQLVDAFELCPFSGEEKSKFGEVVADKLMGGGEAGGSSDSQRYQTIKIENYLLEQKYLEIGDPRLDIAVKPDMLAAVFGGNGCFFPSEPSVARGAVLLATVGLGIQVTNVSTLHTLHEDLKRAIVNMREQQAHNYPFARIHQYPDSPLELPQDRPNHAYGDLRPVEPNTSIKIIMNRTMQLKFQRNSAKGLRGCPQTPAAAAPAADSMKDTVRMFKEMMGEFLAASGRQALGNGGQGPSGTPGASCNSHDGRPNANESQHKKQGFVPRVSEESPSNAAASQRTGEPQLAIGDAPIDLEAKDGKTREMDKGNAPEGAASMSSLEVDPVKAQREAMHAGRKAATAARKKAKDDADVGPAKKKSKRIANAAAEEAGVASAKARVAVAPEGSGGWYHKVPDKRPLVLLEEKGIAWHMGAKITVSDPKQGYRCFAKHPNPSDKLFRWSSPSKPNKQKAWNAALSHIEKIRKKP